MKHSSKILMLGIPYFLGVTLFAILIGPFLGVIAGAIGAIQKLILSFQVDLARHKYHPLSLAKSRYNQASQAADSDEKAYALKAAFTKNPLSFSGMTASVTVSVLLFIILVPFIAMYALLKGPLGVYLTCYRYWQRHVLKLNTSQIYATWGTPSENAHV